jgi:hypothetical protein
MKSLHPVRSKTHMKKLILELDELCVETFETAEAESVPGTVLAYATTGGGPFGCQDQCMSDPCSGDACQSFSGCISYEKTCFCETRSFC